MSGFSYDESFDNYSRVVSSDSDKPLVSSDISSFINEYSKSFSQNDISYVDDLNSLVDDNSSFSQVLSDLSNSDDISIGSREIPYYELLSLFAEIFEMDESDVSDLDETDISSFLENMSDEEYEMFVDGVKNYYQYQAEYYEDIESTFYDLYTTLSTINSEYKNELDNISTSKDEFIEELNTMLKQEVFYLDTNEYIPDGTDSYKIISATEYYWLQEEATPEEGMAWVRDHFSGSWLEKKYENYLLAMDNLNQQIVESYHAAGYGDEYGKITSYDDFYKLWVESQNMASYARNYKDAAYNKKNSATYEYLSLRGDYAVFSWDNLTSPTPEEIDDINLCRSENSDCYSYTKFLEKYPDCSPLRYMMIAKETIGENFFDSIEGIDNIDQLGQLVRVSEYCPELVSAYIYTYNKYGENAVEQFFDSCKYQINDYCGQLEAQKFLESLKDIDEDKFLDAIKNEVFTTYEGMKDGLDSFNDGVGYSFEALFTAMGILDENRDMSVDDYKKIYILQALQSQKMKEDGKLIRKNEDGTYSNMMNSPIDFTKEYSKFLISLSSNYEISQGIGNMLPSIAIHYLFPSTILGTAALGVSSGGSAYHQSMVQGHSLWSSFAYGLFTGFSESISEKVFGGLPGLGNIETVDLKSLFLASGSEGFQEMIQGIMDTAYQSTFMGEEYLEGIDDFLKDIGKQGLYGALSAGVLNAFFLGFKNIYKSNHFEAISNSPSDTDKQKNEARLTKQWLYDVKNAPFTCAIDGIMFSSQTQMGLNQLVDYYTYVKNHASVSEKFFLQKLNGCGLWIADFPAPDEVRSYQVRDSVFIDSSALSNKIASDFYHEVGHFYDRVGRRKNHREINDLVNFILSRYYSENINDVVSKFKKDFFQYRKNLEFELENNRGTIKSEIEKNLANQYYNYYNWSMDKRKSIIEEEYKRYRRNYIDKQMRNSGYGAISDIFDAITRGKLRDSGVGLYGHGSEYYNDSFSVATEILANISDLVNNHHLYLFYKYFSNGVWKNFIRIYEDLVGIRVIHNAFNSVYSPDYLGTVNFVNDLLYYLSTNDSSNFRNLGDFGDFILSCSKNQIMAYLISSEVTDTFLSYNMDAIDSMLGDGYFIDCLEKYVETGNFNYIANIDRNSNLGDFVKLLPRDKILVFIAMHNR